MSIEPILQRTSLSTPVRVRPARARLTSLVGASVIALVTLGAISACGFLLPDEPTPDLARAPDADLAPSDEAPDPPPPAPSPEGNVVTYAGTAVGLATFTANGRIQPHGAPTDYYFEYGPTANYGTKTPAKPLAPRLAAFYHESWDTNGLAGWRGGSGDDLKYQQAGGITGGFVRYTEPTGTDYNHADGIGLLHLVQYVYPGIFDADAPTMSFGGGDPDFRDAKVKVVVRGNDWKPGTTELAWWSQVDLAHGKPAPGQGVSYSNWAHTGFYLTDSLLTGKWESVEYRLYNDSTDWSYAGSNAELNAELKRNVYVYSPLDEVLSHLDVDIFHNLLYVDPYHPPTGSIDFDDYEVAYRNHSLVFASNGARLTSFPPGSADDPQALTDGWRNGAGKMWKSGPAPKAPLELVYDFDQPVTIDKVQLHQHTEFPSKDVEVLTSADGTTWTSIVTDVIPQNHPAGPNFTFLLAKDLAAATPAPAPARKLKVRITSGYLPDYWGLGEIEVFGTGNVMRTDDEEYRVTGDITGLTAGQTIHYRLVATNNGKTELGGDQVYTVPVDAKPDVRTGPATRIASGTAKLAGVVNSLGQEAQVSFEYGPDTAYKYQTDPVRTGVEITPRVVFAMLQDLGPGITIHYRLVVTSQAGTTRGRDKTFDTK